MYESFYAFSPFVTVWNVHVAFGLIINIMLMEFLWLWVHFYFFFISSLSPPLAYLVILQHKGILLLKKNLLNGIRLSVVMHSNQTPAKEYSRQIRYTNIKGITV